MRLTRFITETTNARTATELFAHLREYVRHYGADCLSYHLVQSHLTRIDLEDGFVVSAFPSAWLTRYREKRYFEIDPIIQAAIHSTKPFHWFDVDKLHSLSAAQKAFMDDLQAFGMKDGLAIPIFGPTGNVAYFGVGSTIEKLDLPQHDILSIQYACSQTHTMYMELSGQIDTAPTGLSARETEVLGLLVRGKSNRAIASSLGVSENTVDTLVRRCFSKLDVHDRVSAAVKGIALGIVVR
ncbi:MAG: LuxR family transcriptional regulator [Pseudomonadota bacterium]